MNAALNDYRYPLSSPEEVVNKLNGGKVFSKIDLSEAYLQIPVEENSSKLLCINTHRGLYKFDRLVFGIKVAPAIFQQVMDTMLGGFDFTLGIIFAVWKFHWYLHGRSFTLQTDHKPLITIFGSKKGLPIYTANRLLRWGTILLNYNFKTEYLPSKRISHADGLSRLVPKYSEPFEDTIIAALRTECEIKNMIANTIKELPVTLLEIKSEAMNDDFITNIQRKITAKNEKVPEVFSLCDNVLLFSEKVVIPKKLQNRILRDFHTGHPGINRMKSLTRSYVYWPRMYNDITDMIENVKAVL